MKINEYGKDFIKKEEGYRAKLYGDINGWNTIGYGHSSLAPTIDKYPFDAQSNWSNKYALKVFAADLSWFEAEVNKILNVKVTNNQYSALVSYAFNKGISGLKNSKIVDYINAGEITKASNAFMSDFSTGNGQLNNRRSSEQQLFNAKEPDENAEASITWMKEREYQVKYSSKFVKSSNSQTSATAVYFALIQGGYFPENIRIGTLADLNTDLETYGWKKVKANNGNYPTKRGNIFIWGKLTNTSESEGHAGIFLDELANPFIVHCNAEDKSIGESYFNQRWVVAGKPDITVYTPTNTKPSSPIKLNDDQINKWALKAKDGTFYPDRTLEISGDPTVASPALGTIGKNKPIKYDYYTLYDGYAWISYISNQERRYIAVGPDDDDIDNVWGTGFFN